MEKFIFSVERNAHGKGRNRLSEIIRNFILLNILDEHGGVTTDGRNIIVEKFDWLRDITRNPYVNRGNRGFKPQIVGFYSIDRTDGKRKENLRPFKDMVEVDKYTTIFPSMEDYFIAALKGTTFIAELIRAFEYTFLWRNIQIMYVFMGKDYYEYFSSTVKMILRNKQAEIDETNKESFR